MIETVVNFLIRIAFLTSESREANSNKLSSHPVTLLRDALVVWPKAGIKFQYFEKLMSNSPDAPANLSTVLDIFNVIIDFQAEALVSSSSSQIKQLFSACMKCEKGGVVDRLTQFLTKFLEVFPLSQANAKNEVIQVYRGVSDVISESIRQQNHRVQAHNALRCLRVFADSTPSIMDRFTPQIVKLAGDQAERGPPEIQ